MEKPNNALYIPQFDIIRFFAAFMIVIYHAFIAWNGWFGIPGFLSTGDYKTFTVFGGHVERLIKNFPIGVDIFFFISGYLLTYLLIIEKEKYGKVNIPLFYLRRGLRIWPLYFFLIALAPFLVKWLGEPQPNYLANILFINNFNTIQTETWHFPFAHFWSICIEEHFYLVWPIILALVPRKNLTSAIIALIALSWGYKLYTAIPGQATWYHVYLHTLSRIDTILLGALLADIYLKKPFQFRLNKLTMGIIIGFLILILSFDTISNYDMVFARVLRLPVYTALLGLIFADLLFNPEHKFAHKMWKPFMYLGKASYGIYMYGNILVTVIIKKVLIDSQINNIYLYYFLIISLSLLIPVISYELLEKPFLKLKQRFALVKTRY
jgi:peptidoglycan/LPS O-acetylase OafA/YrhL